MAMRLLMAFILSGTLFFGCTDDKPQTNNTNLIPISVGGPTQELSALVFIAKHKNFFKDNGLDVDVQHHESGVHSIRALLNGGLDIALTSGFVLVSFSFDNPNLRILNAIAEVNVMELIGRKDKAIHELKDLSNKKIGVTKKAPGEFFLDSFLVINETDIKNAQILDLPPKKLVSGILSGSLDAIITWTPHTYNVKKEMGANAVSWSVQLDENFLWMPVVREEDTRTKAPVYIKFTRALMQAEKYITANPMDAKKIVQEHMNVSGDYIDYYWPRHQFKVTLPQKMLLRFEEQARWQISHGIASKSEPPNYLNYIYFDALQTVSPEAITIIR